MAADNRTELIPAPGSFVSPVVDLRHLGGRLFPLAVLQSDVEYRDRADRLHIATGEGCPVPGPLILDGMTIPRAAWTAAGMTPYRNRYLAACVIHDHYCCKALTYPPGPERARLRLEADRLFSQMVAALGASLPLQGTLYRSVRMGALCGWFRREPVWPDYQHEPAAFRARLFAEYD